MKFICPLIVVKDVERSKNFYEKVMGQAIKYDFGENVTFHGDFAIHLESHYSGLIGNREIIHGSNSSELYFEYDDIESAVKKLKSHGVIFVHDIREQPWRQRVVRFYDPDMHIIEIGESLEYLSFRLWKEDLDIPEISEIINMPVEFVEKSIAKFRRCCI